MGEKFSEEEVDEIIKEFDKDGDEQVCLDNLKKFIKKLLFNYKD